MSAPYIPYRERTTRALLEILRESYGLDVTFDNHGRMKYIPKIWPPVPIDLSLALQERKGEVKALLASIREARRGKGVPDAAG